MAQWHVELHERLKSVGYGHGKSNPTSEGQARILLESVVEAIVSQERRQNAQDMQMALLTRAVQTRFPTDELAVYEAGKGREPLSQQEVVRVVERSPAGSDSVGFPDFGEGPLPADTAEGAGQWVQHASEHIMGPDSDEFAQMGMDSDRG